MNDKILFVDDRWKEEEWDIEFKKRMPKEWEFIYEKRGDNALQQIKKYTDIKVVLLDLNFEGQHKQGEEILKEIKTEFPAIPIIILTAVNDVPTARKLCLDVKIASHYEIKQNLDYEKLKLEIRNCIELYNLQTDNIRKTDLGYIIGESVAIKKVLQSIEKVCLSDFPVLITGESGTGKELVARSIHGNSLRKTNEFIRVNCPAIVESLMESELFGHVKGAFANAIKDRNGRFELADGGTLFLDEIGELKQDLQAKLLRVLQFGEFEKVGGEKTIKVNVRIISATNRDLLEMIENGSFREDLYYRLNGYGIHVPPLRERKDDIPFLVKYNIDKLNSKMQVEKEISKEAMELLSNYNWPGNIREIEKVLERVMIDMKDSPLKTLGKECFSSSLNQSRGKIQEDTEDNIWAEKLIRGEKKWEDLKNKFQTEQKDRILNIAKELAIEKNLSSKRGVMNWLADHIGMNRSALSQRIGEERKTQQESNSLEKENVN